jgi:hypothetical protein
MVETLTNFANPIDVRSTVMGGSLLDGAERS